MSGWSFELLQVQSKKLSTTVKQIEEMPMLF